MISGPVCALGTLAIDLIARKARGLRACDILFSSGRWGLIAMLAALFNATQNITAVHFFGTALILLAGDLLTYTSYLSVLTLEPFLVVLKMIFQEGILLETVQYLIGIFGALIAANGLWTLSLLFVPAGIAYVVFKQSREVSLKTRRLLEGISDLIDLRDPYTGGHSLRVAAYCERMLKTMNIGGIESDMIIMAARLHDIGKVIIPDKVLNNPGKLSKEEMCVIQNHSAHGAKLLEGYADFLRGVDIVRHHHEAWDGKGYPAGLKGFEIPFGARLIAVADTFDALTTDRPYRKAMTRERARQVLEEGAGKQWDPEIVSLFLKVVYPLEEQKKPANAYELRPEVTTAS
jgi:putative nucleotidyltransferase with HDIG domain